MIVKCAKCENIIDLKTYISIVSYIDENIPIKCKHCGNTNYYKNYNAGDKKCLIQRKEN